MLLERSLTSFLERVKGSRGRAETFSSALASLKSRASTGSLKNFFIKLLLCLNKLKFELLIDMNHFFFFNHFGDSGPFSASDLLLIALILTLIEYWMENISLKNKP